MIFFLNKKIENGGRDNFFFKFQDAEFYEVNMSKKIFLVLSQ